VRFDPTKIAGEEFSHEYILDPDGTDVSDLAGVTYHQGKLYMGSLKNDFIAVYNLS
jgi:hypothetical protein